MGTIVRVQSWIGAIVSSGRSRIFKSGEEGGHKIMDACGRG